MSRTRDSFQARSRE